MTLWVEVTQGKSSSYHVMWPYKHRGSGDAMILICHVILQNHVIIWLFDFMGKRQSS